MGIKKTGSGGKNKRRLEGKGPTPKATDRTYHAAFKRKSDVQKRRAADPKLARKKAAQKGAKLKTNKGTEIIYGRNAVAEALAANVPAKSVIIASGIDSDERIRQIIELSNSQSVPLLEATRLELDIMTKNGSHQGVLLQIPPYQYADLGSITHQSKRIVMLDHVTDPANLGAIVRSAAAFGADIIIPNRRSATVNATVWKVSAGNLTKVKVAEVANLTTTIKQLQKQGWYVVGLDGEGETLIGAQQLKTDAPVVIVAGSEGSGLARLVQESCDEIAKIETAVESLNVGTAVSIALYALNN